VSATEIVVNGHSISYLDIADILAESHHISTRLMANDKSLSPF
jgi:hypothetical protein